MAVMMLSMIAPMALAQADNETPISYGNESAVEDVSELADDSSIAPSTETTEINEELDAEENETASTGEILTTQIRSWFTFNQEKKAELELKIAKLRLIQAKIAAKNNNTEAMEKALEAHERIINKVQERMSKLDGASDAQGLNNSAVKLIGLERAIQVHEARIARLNLVLENANLTEKQRENIEARISKAEEVTEKLQEISDEKQEKIKTKLMAVKNITEEEAEDLVEQRVEKIEQKVKERTEIREKIREKIKNESDDSETEIETEVETEIESEVETESS